MIPALLLLCALQDAPEFTKFELSRERVGHKVTAEATLQNNGSADLRDARVTVHYYSGDREVGKSETERVARIRTGRSAKLKLEAKQVEKFDRYEIVVEIDDEKHRYTGTDDLPVYQRPEQPQRKPLLQLRDKTDYKPSSHPGEAKVVLKVTNDGKASALEPTVILTFLNKNAAAVQKLRVRLHEDVAAGAEDEFEVAVPDCPEYDAVRAELIWQVSQVNLPPGEFTKEEKFEVGECRMVRFTDGSLRIQGKARNGTPKGRKDVTIFFQLGEKEKPLKMGVIDAGSIRDFEFFVPEAPPFESWTWKVSYADVEDEKEAAAPPKPKVDRIAHRVPEEKAPEKKTGGAKQTVSLSGVRWIAGYYNRVSKKYTGDVAFLKLAFRDNLGKPIQLAGTLTAILYDGDRPIAKINRPIKKGAWKVDASKINDRNAAHTIVAFDRTKNELWVGLHRTDDVNFDLKLDITFTVRKVGVWKWKTLEDPFESAPRGPDAKK